jgi:predicted aspartyl protease
MAESITQRFPYPYLQVRCHIHQREFNVEALVDTGYDGGWVIPEPEYIGLPKPTREALLELGDGTRRISAEYVGTIALADKKLQVSVLFLGNEYLIGREVVDQLRLCFHRGEYLEIET